MITEPQERKLYGCRDCGYQTASEGNLSRHRSSVHGDRQYKCQHCFKTFVTAYYLKQHIRSMHENEKLLCEVCSKHFNTRQALSRHKRIAHEEGDPLFLSSICNRGFSDKFHYEGHVNSHLHHKAYQCKSCVPFKLY